MAYLFSNIHYIEYSFYLFLGGNLIIPIEITDYISGKVIYSWNKLANNIVQRNDVVILARLIKNERILKRWGILESFRISNTTIASIIDYGIRDVTYSP